MEGDIVAVLNLAAAALEAEQKKVAALEKKIAEIENNETLKKAKNKNFTFLIGSAGSLDRMPLQAACESVLKFKEKSGSNPQAIFYGGEDLCLTPVAETEFEKASEKSYEDTDFSHVVDYLDSLAGAPKTGRHYVVISDGKLSLDDYPKSILKMENFLKQNPKSSVDFIFSARYAVTRMQQLSKNLQEKFPKQVTSQRLNGAYVMDHGPLTETMDEAVMNVTRLRTAPVQTKKLEAQFKL